MKRNFKAKSPNKYEYKVQYVISRSGKVDTTFRRVLEACKWFVAYEQSNPGKYKLEKVLTGETDCKVHERITFENAKKIAQGGAQ